MENYLLIFLKNFFTSSGFIALIVFIILIVLYSYFKKRYKKESLQEDEKKSTEGYENLLSELKKINNENGMSLDGKIKVPLPDVLFMMKHYKRRNAISEDGVVVMMDNSTVAQEQRLKTNQNENVESNQSNKQKEIANISQEVRFGETFKVQKMKDKSVKLNTENGFAVIKDGKIAGYTNEKEISNKKEPDNQNTQLVNSINELVDTVAMQTSKTQDSNKVQTNETDNKKEVFTTKQQNKKPIVDVKINEDCNVEKNKQNDSNLTKNEQVEENKKIGFRKKLESAIIEKVVKRKDKRKPKPNAIAVNPLLDNTPKLKNVALENKELLTEADLLKEMEGIENYCLTEFEKFLEEKIYQIFSDKNKGEAMISKIFNFNLIKNGKIDLFYFEEEKNVLCVSKKYFLKNIIDGALGIVEEENIIEDEESSKPGQIINMINAAVKNAELIAFKLLKYDSYYLISKKVTIDFFTNGEIIEFKEDMLEIELQNSRSQSLENFLNEYKKYFEFEKSEVSHGNRMLKKKKDSSEMDNIAIEKMMSMFDSVYNVRKENEIQELKEKAYTCPKTKLLNHSSFMENIDSLFIKENFALAFVDGDKFKNINDTYGHDCGDEILKMLSSKMKSETEAMFENTKAYRYGGEEFIILFWGEEKNVILKSLENVRAAIENTITKYDQHEIKFTVSIGIDFKKNESSWNEMLKNADDALYKAKETGRNKIIVFDK